MMVMKKIISRSYPMFRGKRLNVSEAKAKLSQALHDLQDGPTIIHNRGRDVGVLISVEDYERLSAAENAPPTMSSFLHALEALKQRFGGGAELPVERARLVPRNPFKGHIK
jgi:prevent-host-death family protein